MRKYLATMGHYGGAKPCNHGLVTIDDEGMVSRDQNDDDPTPIEDFGMWMLRDKPFRDDSQILKLFIRLLEIEGL